MVAFKLSNKLQNLFNLKGYGSRKMFTMRKSHPLVFSSSVLLSIKNKTKQTSHCVLCIHHIQTNSGWSFCVPVKNKFRLSSDCKISPAVKKSRSSKLRKYNMVSNILLLKEATTESSYLLKAISAFWCRTKTKTIPTTVNTFKTSISNLIFIRMLFFPH